jgi:hypothetical protein
MVPHAKPPHGVVFWRITLLIRESIDVIHTFSGYSKKLAALCRAVGGLGWQAGGRLMTLSGKENPISLIYCVAIDREVDAREVGRLVSAFGIPDERLLPLLESILLKNDLKTSGQISGLGHAAAT